jgi:hypothetical protein
MARKPSANPKRARFAALLAQHLANGTRPATGAGEPWSYAAFAGETSSGRSEDGYASQRSVSNWCKGKSLPVEIEPILRALFGPESGLRHAAARAEVRAAFKAARTETVVRGKRDAAGVIWVPSGDQVIIDRSAQPSDQRAAEDPLEQQIQAEIRELAAALVEPTKRLNNTRVWSRLSKTAADFSVLVNVDPSTFQASSSVRTRYLRPLAASLRRMCVCSAMALPWIIRWMPIFRVFSRSLCGLQPLGCVDFRQSPNSMT